MKRISSPTRWVVLPTCCCKHMHIFVLDWTSCFSLFAVGQNWLSNRADVDRIFRAFHTRGYASKNYIKLPIFSVLLHEVHLLNLWVLCLIGQYIEDTEEQAMEALRKNEHILKRLSEELLSKTKMSGAVSLLRLFHLFWEHLLLSLSTPKCSPTYTNIPDIRLAHLILGRI